LCHVSTEEPGVKGTAKAICSFLSLNPLATRDLLAGADAGYLAAMPFALVRKYMLDLCPSSLLSAAAETAAAD